MCSRIAVYINYRFDLLEEEVRDCLKQPHFIEKGMHWLHKLGYFTHIDISTLPSVLVSYTDTYMYVHIITVSQWFYYN